MTFGIYCIRLKTYVVNMWMERLGHMVHPIVNKMEHLSACNLEFLISVIAAKQFVFCHNSRLGK